MSYYETLSRIHGAFLKEDPWTGLSERDVERALGSDSEDLARLSALLAPAAEACLEAMAQKAHTLTVRHFGRTIQLYTPLYLSDFCENQCVYCGFNAKNKTPRRKLDHDEVEQESLAIARNGIEHVLALTGDSRVHSPVPYILDCLRVLRKHFCSVSFEIYALTDEEYSALVREGADGLTLYQETYDETVYGNMHLAGPKKDYRFRLDAPERAARSGMRQVNIGALLGLNDWRKEVFFLALHAKYLQDRYPETEIGVSLPRLRPHAGDQSIPSVVTSRDLVQAVTALRLFLPRVGITLSTREAPRLRERLLPLGITRMSAGSSTRVGGHAMTHDEAGNIPQFDISDERSVAMVKTMIASSGYLPVLKDWVRL